MCSQDPRSLFAVDEIVARRPGAIVFGHTSLGASSLWNVRRVDCLSPMTARCDIQGIAATATKPPAERAYILENLMRVAGEGTLRSFDVRRDQEPAPSLRPELSECWFRAGPTSS